MRLLASLSDAEFFEYSVEYRLCVHMADHAPEALKRNAEVLRGQLKMLTVVWRKGGKKGQAQG